MAKFTSVFELARSAPSVNSPAFHRLFELSVGYPRCKTTPQLQSKYGDSLDTQTVARVENRVTLAQCWYNEARTKKPQTFAGAANAAAAAFDPLHNGSKAGCDFCSWQELTAEDSWGRVEGPHAVSASNLFKYIKPAQGVVMFKHHDPLHFSLPQLQDLVAVSHAWFQQAAAHEAEQHAALGLPPRQLYPLLVWNCLPRAGASQYHGHCQVLLSDAAYPSLQQEAESVACYTVTQGRSGRGYYQDVLAAHDDVGLLLREGREGDFAFAYANLAPWKDMEVVVHGSSMESAAFQRMLHISLRTLIDELGVSTFNASINPGAMKLGSANSNSNGSQSNSRDGFTSPQRGEAVPVVARVVSRGKLSSLASDFGGLEVMGGASIGHTDPYTVIDALRRVQAALPPPVA